MSEEVSEKQPSKFEKALQSWAQIDLPTLQHALDEQGIEIKEQQKSSLLSRKELATRTKDFKKLDDDLKLNSFKSLLKLYQNEIDSLTKKNKSLETYFFGIYRTLVEAPDPKPLLEASLDAVCNSTEIDKLKEEINSLNLKLSKVADYDQIKERLLKTEQRSAEVLSSRLNSKEEEFKAIIDEKERNWGEKETELNRKLQESNKKVEEIMVNSKVTELKLNNQSNELGSSFDNKDSKDSSTLLSELELVTRDAEFSQSRVLQLEKRNEELRRELSIAKSGIENENLKISNNEKLSSLESENALLLARLENNRKINENQKLENKNKIESLVRELSQSNTEIKSLKSKLMETADYNEIKSELQILKQIELGLDEEDEPQEQGTEAELLSKTTEVDSILISRNRKLTQELSEYRASQEQLTEKITNLEKQLTDSTRKLYQLNELNTKLENDMADLQDIQTNSNNRFETGSIISGISRVQQHPSNSARGNGRNGRVSPASSIAGGIFNEPNDNSIGNGPDPSILPIVVKQRDRFRTRNKELEEELKKQYSIIADLKRKITNLKKDNEQLYERTRYLASFENQQRSSKKTSSINGLNNNNNNRLNHTYNIPNNGNSVDLERNYQQSYEERLNPIEKFRIQEQERINSKLSPLERIFISFARAILATRTSRMLFMCYCLGLHFVVMTMTVYVMGLSTSLMPEVGLGSSTGGFASGNTGSTSNFEEIGN